MGAGASAHPASSKYLDELTKPADASDLPDESAARAEVVRLRALLHALRAHIHSADTENGHSHIAELIEKSVPLFAALNATCAGRAADAPAVMDVGLIADQDQDAKAEDGSKWSSAFAYGKLTYDAAAKTYSYKIEGESEIATTEHDKSDRGAEYSLLELFGGKLVTACDRTGNLDEIVPNPDFGTVEGAAKYTIAPVKDASGERVKLLLGDGKKPKPLKCEWSTIKDGKLVIGSTGKERTDDDGNVVHQGEMWCKTFDENWAVTHEDWIAKYGALRGPTKCPHGAGFMIHEGARWSDVHQKWFFIPRKLSREPYVEATEGGKCCNLMIACDPDFSEASGMKLRPPLSSQVRPRLQRGLGHRDAAARHVRRARLLRLLLRARHERHAHLHDAHGGERGGRAHVRVRRRPLGRGAHGGARDRQEPQVRGRVPAPPGLAQRVK